MKLRLFIKLHMCLTFEPPESTGLIKTERFTLPGFQAQIETKIVHSYSMVGIHLLREVKRFNNNGTANGSSKTTGPNKKAVFEPRKFRLVT